MDLHAILKQNESTILKRWRDALIDTYPSDSRRFLRKEKDSFANPVGGTFSSEIESIVREFVEGGDNFNQPLQNIISIRAVQDFIPSDAISFVYSLKGIIRDIIAKNDPSSLASKDMAFLEEKIDRMALLAFDIFSERRQKIYDIRVREVKNHLGKLLQRHNLTVEIPEGPCSPGDENNHSVS